MSKDNRVSEAGRENEGIPRLKKAGHTCANHNKRLQRGHSMKKQPTSESGPPKAESTKPQRRATPTDEGTLWLARCYCFEKRAGEDPLFPAPPPHYILFRGKDRPRKTRETECGHTYVFWDINSGRPHYVTSFCGTWFERIFPHMKLKPGAGPIRITIDMQKASRIE